MPKVKFQNPVNPETSSEQKYYPMPFSGIVDPMHDSKWAWGFGINVVGGMGTDYQLQHDLFRDQTGNFIPQDYYSNFGYLRVGPGVSYQLKDNFSVGLGAQLYYGMLDFKMPFSIDPIANLNGVANPQTGATFGQLFAASPQTGGFGYQELTAYAAMEGLDGFGFGANIGLYWEVNEMLSLGLAYTSPSRIHFEGEATMDMSAQLNQAFGLAVQGVMMQNPGLTAEQAQAQVFAMFGGMGIDLQSGVETTFANTKADFDIPQKLALGIGLKPHARWTFGLDVEWIDWSAAFDNFPLSFRDGDNANINLMLNGDVQNGAFDYAFPLAWEDVLNFKMGADFKLTDMTRLRAGFIHGSNPVPNNTVFAIFPAIVENHLTMGIGQRLGVFDLDVAFIHAFNKTQTAVSNGHLLANEYNGSIDQLSENLMMTTISFGF
jgi:long-chain fatty acid transport protein